MTGLEFMGTPYVFNASSDRTDQFDCSSFMQYIYGVNGINLPRNSRQQFAAGKRITNGSIKRGDLLFFTTPKRSKYKGISKVGHVGMYIGNQLMLHTSRKRGEVVVEKLTEHWRKRFIGSRRVLD
ncbi:C40 family peptidase [Metabacillus arenae]|uniref:C40 family peptidase n=1 Tax=Metabacillus arenae TaxID=2771434 RepID=A0A926NFI4_9BACI|nr:C40 family peptidase [Metabacillus arenae]MBD1379558.1 C40 family peptidase [Metabacillus arenae]